MRYLAPIPSQFLDENGTPYYNGKVYVYIHGDSKLALADIYQNAETDELAENPATLDSHGMWQAFVDADRSFDYLVKDSDGNVVASFYDVTFPTGEGVPEIYVESRDGTINVEKSLSEGRQTFNIEVNKDTFKPAYARFTHSTVSGSGTDVELDSFEPDGDGNSDIYLTDGKLTLAKGLYHVSMNMCLGNDSLGNEYLEVIISFGGNELKKVWDGSFIHEESVELGMDISVEEDSSVVLPTINDFPEGMYCSITRLDVHSVGGAGAAGSHSVEHDGTLVGDGTHENPLGVKDYSEIRSDVDAVSESLTRHETANDAHQDIRDELERKEDKDNKVTSWGSTPSNEKYPSEKLVKDTIDNLPPGTAVKGDAEIEYRTGNVNLTPANIGAATASQGAKADTAVQGVKVNGAELTKDENNKVSIPDGTTMQKGVVQLSNAINSTSTTEAATPKAVKDAYDELNNKIVARAVFLSQAEWAVQSQLQGDPAKVYYVENGTGEDAYTVYVWRESTSTYEEVDESSIDLDGYWHDSPTTTGNGNVVTNITLGNDGVPQIEKGLTALTQHQLVADNDPTLAWGTRSKVGTIGGTELHVTMPSNPASGKLDSTGDASNTTSTFTKASGDTSTMTRGSKLSVIFTAISSFFASVASALGGKADKANITGATKCKITYNGQGIVTSGDNLTADDIPNLPASKITSGQFGTDRIADDAITAAKVKDNETLPVNIYGKANTASTTYTIRKNVGAGVYTAIAELINNATSLDYSFAGLILSFTTRTSYTEDVKGLIVISPYEFNKTDIYARTILLGERAITSSSNIPVFVIKGNADKKTLQVWSIVNRSCVVALNVLNSSGWSFNEITDTSSSIPSDSYISELYKNVIARTTDNYNNSAQVGDPSTPVYVDSNGQVQPCTQGATLKSNTATLYIAGYTGNNIPYYHVKDIKNGCVNHVDFSGITNSTCNITFEAPTLSTGEEYDYIISLEGYTNNSGYSTGAYVENCKQVLRYDYVNNLWIGEPLFLQATDWRQICVVRGNTFEWKRVALS